MNLASGQLTWVLTPAGITLGRPICCSVTMFSVPTSHGLVTIRQMYTAPKRDCHRL
jgi:hypothetical protein